MAIAFKKSFDFTKGLVSFNKPRKNCNGVVVDRLGQLFVCKLGLAQLMNRDRLGLAQLTSNLFTNKFMAAQCLDRRLKPTVIIFAIKFIYLELATYSVCC